MEPRNHRPRPLRRRGRNVERVGVAGDQGRGGKRIRTVSPDRDDFDNRVAAASSSSKGHDRGMGSNPHIFDGNHPRVLHGLEITPLSINVTVTTATLSSSSSCELRQGVATALGMIEALHCSRRDYCGVGEKKRADNIAAAASRCGSSSTTTSINALDQLYDWSTERHATFIEAMLEHKGVEQLLNLIHKFSEQTEGHDEGRGRDGFSATIVIQKAAQILAHCLFYSQSHDEERHRKASTKLAYSMIMEHNGLHTLGVALEKILGTRGAEEATFHAFSRPITALWVLLNNLTLFGAVMTVVEDDDKIRLLDTALVCLERCQGDMWRDEHGNEDETRPRKLLPLWGSIFGVLSNLLARESASPSSERGLCLEQAYIGSRCVRRCMAFVQRWERQLFQTEFANQTVLVRILEFFEQCARRPAVEAGAFCLGDYHSFLLPLCVDGIRIIAFASNLESSTEALMLREKAYLHACILLKKCSLKRIDMKQSKTIFALQTILKSSSSQLTDVSIDPSLNYRRSSRDEQVGRCLTRELALKIVQEITIPSD
eukprot:CAMPEP_0178786744 /NCGR_PEP_ID=MMETSP0745-20121128/5475_1 /TAXON_ID=913974 /ORGANISM="Nitzschia punctata, Strain CCMP561" /LENGTH=543 /DNA_ID=CAMNT_0020444529 /DNA_START=99 /DNA_END=1730 /DNA_ORIENTATION=+